MSEERKKRVDKLHQQIPFLQQYEKESTDNEMLVHIRYVLKLFEKSAAEGKDINIPDDKLELLITSVDKLKEHMSNKSGNKSVKEQEASSAQTASQSKVDDSTESSINTSKDDSLTTTKKKGSRAQRELMRLHENIVKNDLTLTSRRTSKRNSKYEFYANSSNEEQPKKRKSVSHSPKGKDSSAKDNVTIIKMEPNIPPVIQVEAPMKRKSFTTSTPKAAPKIVSPSPVVEKTVPPIKISTLTKRAALATKPAPKKLPSDDEQEEDDEDWEDLDEEDYQPPKKIKKNPKQEIDEKKEPKIFRRVKLGKNHSFEEDKIKCNDINNMTYVAVRQGIIFQCLIGKCLFQTMKKFAFINHLEENHKSTSWCGNCKTCKSMVGKKNSTLEDEFWHMMEKHVHTETNKKNRDLPDIVEIPRVNDDDDDEETPEPPVKKVAATKVSNATPEQRKETSRSLRSTNETSILVKAQDAKSIQKTPESKSSNKTDLPFKIVSATSIDPKTSKPIEKISSLENLSPIMAKNNLVVKTPRGGITIVKKNNSRTPEQIPQNVLIKKFASVNKSQEVSKAQIPMKSIDEMMKDTSDETIQKPMVKIPLSTLTTKPCVGAKIDISNLRNLKKVVPQSSVEIHQDYETKIDMTNLRVVNRVPQPVMVKKEEHIKVSIKEVATKPQIKLRELLPSSENAAKIIEKTAKITEKPKELVENEKPEVLQKFINLRPWLSRPVRKNVQQTVKLLDIQALVSNYKCMAPRCDFHTNNAVTFKYHLENHIRLSPCDIATLIICPYCDEDFSCYFQEDGAYVMKLIEHIVEAHGYDNYQCKYCFYRSCANFNVMTHQKIHHRLQPNHIVKLGKGKVRDYAMEVNRVKESCRPFIKPLMCPTCKLKGIDRKFFVLKHFYVHLNTHEKNREIIKAKCKKCDRLVTNADTLYSHVFECFGSDLGMFQCVYCLFATNTAHTMHEHLSNHHPSLISLVCMRNDNEPMDPEAYRDQVESATLKCISLPVPKHLIFRSPADLAFIPALKIPKKMPTLSIGEEVQEKDLYRSTKIPEKSSEQIEADESPSKKGLFIESVYSLSKDEKKTDEDEGVKQAEEEEEKEDEDSDELKQQRMKVNEKVKEILEHSD